MRTIHKYQLPIVNRSVIEMPVGAQILSVQAQGDIPTIWALVDTKSPMEKRVFYMAGTGHIIPDGEYKHLGTIQLLGGNLVYHIFQ